MGDSVVAAIVPFLSFQSWEFRFISFCWFWSTGEGDLNANCGGSLCVPLPPPPQILFLDPSRFTICYALRRREAVVLAFVVAWTTEAERVRLLHDSRGVRPSSCGFWRRVAQGIYYRQGSVGVRNIFRVNSALQRSKIGCGEGYDDGYQRRAQNSWCRS